MAAAAATADRDALIEAVRPGGGGGHPGLPGVGGLIEVVFASGAAAALALLALFTRRGGRAGGRRGAARGRFASAVEAGGMTAAPVAVTTMPEPAATDATSPPHPRSAAETVSAAAAVAPVEEGACMEADRSPPPGDNSFVAQPPSTAAQLHIASARAAAGTSTAVGPPVTAVSSVTAVAPPCGIATQPQRAAASTRAPLTPRSASTPALAEVASAPLRRGGGIGEDLPPLS